MKNFYAILSIFLMVATACNKDEDEPIKDPKTDDEPAVQTNIDKLAGTTSKAWKLTASTIDPAMPWDGTLITNLFDQMPECESDDIMSFSISNTFTMEEGATKCYSGDPQVWAAGSWTFNSDETLIVLTYSGGYVSNLTILELTTTSLKLKYKDYFETSTLYTVTSTYQVK